MKKIQALVATLALGFAGTACTVDSASSPPPPMPEQTYSEPDYHETEEAEEPAPDESGVSEWGETYSWEDGIQVTVGKPSKFKASESASGGEDPDVKTVKFKVTLTNQSGKIFDPSLALTYASAGGEECEQVFDYDNDLGMTPESKIRNGRSVSYYQGYACTGLTDLQVTVAPSFDHIEALWAEEK